MFICLSVCLLVCLWVCLFRTNENKLKMKIGLAKVLPSGFDPYTLGLNRVKSQPCHLTNSLIIWLYCLNDLAIFYPYLFCNAHFVLCSYFFFFPGTNEFYFGYPRYFFEFWYFWQSVCLSEERKFLTNEAMRGGKREGRLAALFSALKR